MAEKLLILTLVAVSAYAFWRRFGTVFHTIMASRKDASFHLAPLGPRVWDFFWEVICQAKVIRERPLPGLAHAFVFWGFCAFALVTLNHFALGMGIPFLHPDHGLLGPFYFALAFAFSLVVAVSITGLAIRRLVVRPKWLGAKVSWESGLIALLILTLMVTFAADYWQRPASASAYARSLWWLHTLALLVFLPLVPHTKHLHLLLSPATVFLSRGGFSRIPPLDGDEDFGLDTGKDVTQLVALQAYSCVECGRCQEHCPAHNTGKLLNPKEIALGFRGYLNEHGAGAEQPLIGVHLSEEAVFQCTTCGACEYQCPVGIEHVPLIVGLRRGAVNTGKWEDEYGGQLFLKLERNGNPLGMAALERDKFLQKNALPLFDGTQEYCLWLGCMGSYDPKGREIVLALVEVLRYLGVTYGVLKKEKCTGDSARRLGNDLAFQQLAEFNMGQLKTAKVKKLLSICPHCVRTIGEDWKELGAEFEIEHHSVFLARHQAQLPGAGGSIGKVVYHDPCYLGRYQDVYDEPRAVISAGGTLVEPGRARERSFCCGAGGGLVFLGEETGSRVSHERARELADTGADVVAAACPFCNTMFQDALSAVRPEGAPQLLDVAQIAAARLPRIQS
ncbi:MAG: (Fe-S)-binding protein [Bryobacterales bacterium]|nr:(Fe-S)-binding protein [Bryobacterales bacterium]